MVVTFLAGVVAGAPGRFCNHLKISVFQGANNHQHHDMASLNNKNHFFPLNVLIITSENVFKPSFRLRLGYFLDRLKDQKRVEYYVNDVSRYSKADIIIIHKEAATLTPDLVRLMIDHPKPVIYETDDLIQQRPLHRTSNCLVTAKQRLLGSWNAAFIVSTSYLADKMKIYSEDVSVIYNAPPFAFNVARCAEATDPRLVCFIGTPSHSPDFALMGNALERVAEKHSKIRYLFIGAAPSRGIREKIPIEICPFNADYHAALDVFHSRKPAVGLAPLLDNPYNRSKSVIKYIDYTHAGTVGIYSDIVTYRGIEGGVLVKNTPDKWYEGICRLIENPELRFQLYKNAVEDIKARFSFKVESERFADILERVAATKPLSSEARKKEAIRLTRLVKDSGQTAEFLEYVRLFYPAYLKGHIAAREIPAAIAKTADKNSLSINLIADVMKVVGETDELKALQKSLINHFITRPYSSVKNMELEMYRFASKAKASSAFTKAMPIFERILQKSSETEMSAGAAFHLGEIALAAAEKNFAECLARNPGHLKARKYLEIMTSKSN